MSIDPRTTRPAIFRLVQAGALGALLSGCLDTQHEAQVQPNTCTACHGDATRPMAKDRTNPTEAAPPFDLNGNAATSAKGVGAHQMHLTESATHTALPCTYCHKVPNEVFAPGHLDNPNGATITFDGLPSEWPQTQPSYDPKTQACTNTYCHGNGQFNWVAPRDSAAACGNSCHSLPPPLPHPQDAQCYQCHGAVIDQNRNFVAKAKHIDGIVETGTLLCNSCHGTDPKTGGPPPDLEGNTESKYPGVGAHANHLLAAPTHGPMACNECHVVPATYDSPGHDYSATPPAVVTFGSLATNFGKASPNYDFANNTCSATYCHGSYNPLWTAPRDSQTACGSCHALPPPAPHPHETDCSLCHSQVIDANRNFVNPSLHVNGTVDVSPPCSRLPR